MYTKTKFKTCRRYQIYNDLLCLAISSTSYLYGRYHAYVLTYADNRKLTKQQMVINLVNYAIIFAEEYVFCYYHWSIYA